jgi:hypothetical protein
MSQYGSLPIITRLIYCNKCNQETNHICKFHEYTPYPIESYEDLQDLAADDPGFSINDFTRTCEINGYLLWSCAGCDSWTVENYSALIPEGDDPPLFDPDTYSSFFIPERTKFHVHAKQFHHLKNALEGIYRETLHSYNNGLYVLCGMGIRALIEGICDDQEIRGKNVAQKIDGLSALLPQNIVNNLHGLRFMGNEAAHELIPPDQEELQIAIGLVEDLLNFLYDLDYRASRLTDWQKKKRAHDKIDKNGPSESDDGSGELGTSSLPSDSDND